MVPVRRVGLPLLVMVAAAAGCDSRKPDASGRSPATAPLDYLAVQGQAKKHAEKALSLAPVQQALQQFRIAEDRWPRELDELVSSGFLAAVPKPPAGQRLIYDPARGTVRVEVAQP